MEVFISLVFLVIVLWVNYLISREFYRAANAKGFYEKKYLWIPFWLGVVGYLLVIALPTKRVEIMWDDADSFNVYVGNTTLEDFNAYVKKCSDAGFDVDYQKGNDYYYSEDSYGNNLDVWYHANDIMQIQIFKAEPLPDTPNNVNSDDYLTTEIIKECEMVEKLFSLNYKEIMSEYPNAEFEYLGDEDSNDLCIEGNFVGLSGVYDICVSDDGTVWRVIFEPEDESLANESVVEIITASLGEYIDYDSEWDNYTWKTDNLEIAYWIEERTYFDWIGEDLDVNKIIENDNEEKSAEKDDESEIGVVENIYTADDIPNELMNDKFKSVIELFSKGFSQSGLSISNATTYDDGETYIFYLEGLEFLGDECEDGYFQPRIIYSKDAINNNGTPNKIYFEIANPLKSNGYEETVEIVEDIAEALDISDFGLIDNDYSSSSKWATGEYATFTFPNLELELTVSNSDGSVEIEIVPGDDVKNTAQSEVPSNDAVCSHEKGEWKLTKDATLTTVGLEECFCTDCGESIDSRGTERKNAKVVGSSFNFGDTEFLDWMNELSTAEFSYIELEASNNGNTSYPVTMDDGITGAIMFNHDNYGNISAIMIWFDDWENAAALAIWIGEKIDTDFSSDDAFLPIANGEVYSAADMVAMRLDLSSDMEVSVLAPYDFFDDII